MPPAPECVFVSLEKGRIIVSAGGRTSRFRPDDFAALGDAIGSMPVVTGMSSYFPSDHGFPDEFDLDALIEKVRVPIAGPPASLVRPKKERKKRKPRAV